MLGVVIFVAKRVQYQVRIVIEDTQRQCEFNYLFDRLQEQILIVKLDNGAPQVEFANDAFLKQF